MFEQLAARRARSVPDGLGDGPWRWSSTATPSTCGRRCSSMLTGAVGLAVDDRRRTWAADAEASGSAPAPTTRRRSSSRSAGSPASPRWSARRRSAACATTHYRGHHEPGRGARRRARRSSGPRSRPRSSSSASSTTPRSRSTSGSTATTCRAGCSIDMGAAFGALGRRGRRDDHDDRALRLRRAGRHRDPVGRRGHARSPRCSGGLGDGLGAGVVNERTVEVAGHGGPVTLARGRGRRRRSTAAPASTASPAPRRTSPTTSTRWPSGAGTPSPPTSAATARAASPTDEAAYTFEAFATDLLGLLDALGWERCVALGHSMGGMVVQTAILAGAGAVRRPRSSWTRRTAGCAPTRAGRARRRHRPHRGHRRRDGGAGRPRARRSPSAPARTSGSLETREGYKEFGDRKMLASSAAMYAAMLQTITAARRRRPPARPRGASSVPTLVLVGEEDTPFRKPSQRMAEAIPGAELVVLPDGGHSPQFESPELWWKALSAFLDRVCSAATGPCRGSARSPRSPG